MAKKFSLESVLTLSDQMTAPMGRVSKQMDKFGKKMQKNFGGVGKQINAMNAGINKAARGAGIVAAGAATAVVLAAKKSTDAWNTQAAAIASVEATLNSTGGSVGRTLSQLEEHAASIQKNTFIGDEAVLQGVTAQMLTFTNITGTAFDRAQQAVVDVAAKLNGLETNEASLRSTTIALSKALNDPVANLGALSRSGIQFSKTQKDMIKGMVESGNVADAQNVILTEIEKQYGGTAAAIAKTNAGLKLQAKNLHGDAWEQLGKAIEPIVAKLLTFKIKVLEVITPMIKKLGDIVTKNMSKISAAIDSVDIEKMIDGFIRFGSIVGKVVGFLIKFAPIILAVVAAIKILAAVQTIYNAVLLVTTVLASPITLIVLAIVAAVALLAAGVYLMVKHWGKVKEVLAGVIDIFKKVGQTMIKWMLTPINLLLDMVGGLLTVLAKIPGLGDLVGGAADAIDEFQGKMNMTMTGSAGAYDYASPWTKGNESRSVSESRQTMVNEVYVRPDKGTAISGARGGAPQQVLMYGAAQ